MNKQGIAVLAILLSIGFISGCAGKQRKLQLESLETRTAELQQKLDDSEAARHSLERELYDAATN